MAALQEIGHPPFLGGLIAQGVFSQGRDQWLRGFFQYNDRSWALLRYSSGWCAFESESPVWTRLASLRSSTDH